MTDSLTSCVWQLFVLTILLTTSSGCVPVNPSDAGMVTLKSQKSSSSATQDHRNVDQTEFFSDATR